MSIKINKLEIENVKRVKAVKIEPTANGLTVVGGKNNQGKTSVLDSIAWALGGDKYRPSSAYREGSTIPPHLQITLSNGLIVERKGKNSDLKVTDPNGQKGGQQLLNEFVEQLALDLPKFMESNNKDKANTLLKIIGVGDKLYELEVKEQEAYNQRHSIGQIADRKEKYAKEMDSYDNVPSEIVSPSELIKQQQEILARNGENAKKRNQVEQIKISIEDTKNKINSIEEKITELQLLKMQNNEKLDALLKDLDIGNKSLIDLHDESTEELERNIAEIDELNRKIRVNLDKSKAEDDAAEYRREYESLTTKIDAIRQEKIDLLNSAQLPLEGLSVEDGELTYKGFKWDNMSGSDQLKVSTAIVRALKPKCGFILLDKLEQMDLDTMKEFGDWLETQGLQAIATRVSTGEECSIIIEDGYVVEEKDKEPVNEVKWKEGEF